MNSPNRLGSRFLASKKLRAKETEEANERIRLVVNSPEGKYLRYLEECLITKIRLNIMSKSFANCDQGVGVAQTWYGCAGMGKGA